MTQSGRQISQDDLHAFVDGRLDETASGEVAAWLGDHPEDAGRVRAYRQQNDGLAALFGGIAEEPVPARLLEATRTRRTVRAPLFRRLAAGLLLLVIGAGAGWFARDVLTAGSASLAALSKEGVAAHEVFVVEVKHPVEVAASQEQHLVKWLTKRLGADIKAPNLLQFGYELVGGRLLSADAGPAAQFMYESRDGQRLTIYVRRNVEQFETAFRYKSAGRLSAFYWLEGPLAYAIVAGMPRANLLNIAHEVYAQLQP